MKNEFSYIAGYIDGDGCLYMGTSIQKTKEIIVFEYSIQILCVEVDNLKSFVKYGGYIRKKAQRPNQKIPYVYVLKNCCKLLKEVYPFLIDKKIQAGLLVKLIESVRSTNFQKVSENIFKHRFELIKQSRENKMSDFVTKESIESIKNTRPSIHATEADLAYLAGFIEAEGCFRIKSWKPRNKPNRVYNISLEIGNTRYPVFPWLMDRFGGSISFIEKKERKRASATWSIQSESLAKILNFIHPYLRTRKKLVCEHLVEFCKTVLPNGGDRHSDDFNNHMIAVIAKREDLIQKIHVLNKKGV